MGISRITDTPGTYLLPPQSFNADNAIMPLYIPFHLSIWHVYIFYGDGSQGQGVMYPNLYY